MVSSFIMRFMTSKCLTFTNIARPTYRVTLASFSTGETINQVGMASFTVYMVCVCVCVCVSDLHSYLAIV